MILLMKKWLLLPTFPWKKVGPETKDTGKYEIFVKFFDDAVVQLLADDTNFQ